MTIIDPLILHRGVLKVHFHSDCPFFAGCEMMLVNFWLSDALRRTCQVSFSYRASEKYKAGMMAQIHPDFPIFPLSLPPVEWPKSHFPSPFTWISKAFRFATRTVWRFPLFFYETWVVFRLIKKIKPDIVHLNNGGYPAARSVRAAAVGARLAGCKSIVMVVNNLAAPYRTLERCFDYLLDRWVVRSTSKFVTGSVAAAERLTAVLRLDASQVQPIHNGVRLREVRETKEACLQRLGVQNSYCGLVFGVVALMVERKGHRVLIDAVEILKRHDPQLGTKLTILFEGGGELRDSLEQSVRGKELDDVIKFVGHEDNVVDLMNAIDVLVLPSIDCEDFPNVTLEAMALGKAVIASNLAGTPEQIVHGETGFLVESGNPKALSSAISLLLDDHELTKQLGRNGQKRFQENFTAELAVDRYLKLYQSMMRDY